MKFNKPRSTWLTNLILVVCVVIFLFQIENKKMLGDYGNIPALINMGEYYRLFTSAFLHGSVFHLIGNVMILSVLGQMLEEKGRLKYILVYLLSAIAGSIMSYLVFTKLGNYHVVSVGASGAIFGLLGYSLNIYIANKDNPKYKAFGRWLMNLILINIIVTFTVPGIDIGAHVGGFLSGLMISLFFTNKEN